MAVTRETSHRLNITRYCAPSLSAISAEVAAMFEAAKLEGVPEHGARLIYFGQSESMRDGSARLAMTWTWGGS